MKPITKLLIANRGEIALRIQRACKKLGIASLSIASEADAKSMFARQAEELVVIGPPPPRDSYLAIDKIVKVALEKGCDAVHPGYGFLSENAQFAQAVVDAGLAFVGPSPEAIRVMGSKTEARARVSQFDVPFTPGTAGGLSDEELMARGQAIGFPLIIKASYGGGGRGMRIVNSVEEMREAIPRARAEAKKNFSNEDVYIEKYILHPRHIEVQVFGDSHGNIIHLGTRDCSTQRRHQKLIEEAPAPNMPPDVREEIHAAAVRAAKSVNYTNAGTIEFLLSGREFYFLEMNTRIQVEHPVTEEVTGVDLVELQLRVAMGDRVPPQNAIGFKGHAIEFRIYAEDPRRNFSPAIGKLGKIERPQSAAYIREDYGFESDDEVTPHYDAMLSKLIVKGETRAQAIERSLQALRQYKVEGLPTTVDFHRWLLSQKFFKEAPIDIGYLDREWKNVAKFLDELRASEVRDPLHRSGPHGTEVVEYLRYRAERFGADYTIEVLHRRDGVFIATPTDGFGRRAPNKNCRASNGFNTAVRATIEDVLEKLDPAEVIAV